MICMWLWLILIKGVYNQSYSERDFKYRGCYFVGTLEHLYFKSYVIYK